MTHFIALRDRRETVVLGISACRQREVRLRASDSDFIYYHHFSKFPVTGVPEL